MSWSRRAVAVLAIALAAAFAAAGCGSSSGGGAASSTGKTTAAAGSEPYTIGLLESDLKDQFNVQQVAQVKAMVAKVGGKVVVLDGQGDPAKQLQVAQDVLTAHHVDALLGSTVDLGAFQPALDQAASQGIPVVFLDKQPPRWQRGEALITQDFKDWGKQMGTAVGRCVTDRLGGNGQVVILDNIQRSGSIIAQLVAGIKEGVATNPSAQVVAQPNAPDRLTALQKMQDVLRAHPGVNAVLGAGDDATLGAMQALESAGKDATKLCIVGSGGTTEGSQMLQNGKFYATVDIRLPFVYGTALKAAWALIKNINDPQYSGKVVPTNVGMLYHKP